MINIMRLGSALLSSPTDIAIRFTCPICHCEFEANGPDAQYDGDLDWYTAKCPCCGFSVHEHEWNRE